MDKSAQKKFFKPYKELLQEAKFTVVDEYFQDGYFIPGDHDGMWHFELKECPNWQFGVWVDKSEDYSKTKCYDFEIFAQPKNYIDKFKPYASVIRCSDCFDKNITDWDKKRFLQLFRYVRNNPYLAWYRHISYTDYNLEYVTPKTAKKEFKKAEKERKLNEKAMEELRARELEWVISKLTDTGFKWKVSDDGKYCYSRYRVMKEDPSVSKTEVRQWLSDEEWEEFEKIEQELKLKYPNVYFHSYFHNDVWIVKKLKDFNE